MYCTFFGLSEKPFGITPDLQFLYLGKQQEQALATLHYGVGERLGFQLLTGEVGAGKTTLARALLARFDKKVATALLINPLLSVPELLKSIAKDFGLTVRSSSPQAVVDLLHRFLLQLAEAGKTALVVIDEAQNLDPPSLEAVRLLTNLETEKQKLLQILLVGQPELVKMLRRHDLRQLEQRIASRVHLTAMDLMEMMRYMNHRVGRAGGCGKVFFEPQACRDIFRASRGYPRLVNLICDRALMAAFLRESTVIDRVTVRSAIADWRGERSPRPWWQGWKRLVAL